MEHICHIILCVTYIILCYAIGTWIDTLLYTVQSDKARRVIVIMSSMFLLVGYMVGIYILIYLIYNILA